jgi:hypothetical protein
MSEDLTPQSSNAGDRDWPAEAADKIVDIVDQVKDRTTRPTMMAAHGIVYGIVLAMVGVALVILLLIALFRMTTFLPGEVYWAYLGWGVVLTIVGLVLWSKRSA